MYPTMQKYVKACRFWAGFGIGKHRYIWHTPSVLHFGDWVAPDVPTVSYTHLDVYKRQTIVKVLQPGKGGSDPQAFDIITGGQSFQHKQRIQLHKRQLTS